MIRPRGTAAALGADMYIVRCAEAAVADAPAAGPIIRVPHAPQNANPVVTVRPQLGQTVPSPVVEAGGTIAAAGGCIGVDEVVDRGGAAHAPAPGSVIAEEVSTGGGVEAPSGRDAIPPPLCWGARGVEGVTEGILGESFQGIPPLGFADVDKD